MAPGALRFAEFDPFGLNPHIRWAHRTNSHPATGTDSKVNPTRIGKDFFANMQQAHQ